MRLAAACTCTFIAICLAALPACAPAQAQRELHEQDVHACLNVNHAFSPDQQIDGCTVAIESGRGSAEATAVFFHQRGIAYHVKNDFAHAIADQSASIKLDPRRAESYLARGLAYMRDDNLDGAIADFAAALEIEPNSAKTLTIRGVALLVRGDIARADDDIARALTIEPSVVVPGVMRIMPSDAAFLGIPANADSWPLSVEIKTAGAVVLVYTPGRAHPVRFDTEKSTKDVPMSGSTLWLVAVPLSANWRLETGKPTRK
jgi:tetratricopeptide (TPR) repeat protein